MSLTWFATNNTVTIDDLPDLEALGIKIGRVDPTPVVVYRDPVTGQLLTEVGTVTVYRDGRIMMRRRQDAPDKCLESLARTALDCHERELHLRDRWAYYRATSTRRVGFWRMEICVAFREGYSPFEAHEAALTPAARPHPVRTEPLHELPTT